MTLVTQDQACLFGEIAACEMRLSPFGRLVETEWQRLVYRFPHLQVDAYVIMPNHIHAMIKVSDATGSNRPYSPRPPSRKEPLPELTGESKTGPSRSVPDPTPKSLIAFIRQFKSCVTKRLQLAGQVWQRKYSIHTIHSQAEYDSILQSLLNHPCHWDQDDNNPMRARTNPSKQTRS
ncbi:MAG: hypothetical protein JXB15_11140 [Anaerolineales bacterium]|nr:hypothetical protein [Anaerolineales bacterium]